MEQKMLRLRKRAEFLAVQKGEKRRGALFLLEVKPRAAGAKPDSAAAAAKGKSGAPALLFAAKGRRPLSRAEAETLPRLGLTVTRKNGNAVRRNRIKRRLREAVRLGGVCACAAAQTDYVIVARSDILAAPFPRLQRELRRRFSAAGQSGARGRSRAERNRRRGNKA